MREKIFILGSSGLLGRNLCHYLKKYYQIIGHINKRSVYLDDIKTVSFDFFNKNELKKYIEITLDKRETTYKKSNKVIKCDYLSEKEILREINSFITSF